MTYTLPNNEKKSVYVEQMFNKIAQKYDLFNDIITFGMHRKWKRFVAKQTDVNKEKYISMYLDAVQIIENNGGESCPFDKLEEEKEEDLPF